MLSAPVLVGLVGGVGMVAGCTGLILLKRRSAAHLSTATMRGADHGLLGALLVLALTGLLTLVLRDTVAFGAILLVHLSAIAVCFAVAPYTKFVHWAYHLLATYADEWEQLSRS